jgi:hypothetical protein
MGLNIGDMFGGGGFADILGSVAPMVATVAMGPVAGAAVAAVTDVVQAAADGNLSPGELINVATGAADAFTGSGGTLSALARSVA